jgi:hypothetical protein
VIPLHALEAHGVRGGIAPTHSLTSALDGGEWSASRPGRALPPVPIVQEAGWVSEPVSTQRLEENPLPLSGMEPRSSSQSLY